MAALDVPGDSERNESVLRIERPGSRFQARVVDGISISAPGSTGTDWMVHCCLGPDNLRCDTFWVTSSKTGESFQRFDVSPSDLLR